MKIVGLTGGIGSGKSTIAKFFEEKGVPVYNADIEAKQLMNRSGLLVEKIQNLFGEQAYLDGQLNRSYIAQKVFNDPILLNQLNGIVHPAVRDHFKSWLQEQTGPYCIREAAILFESGSHRDCDYIILVTAPREIRIERVLKRDDTTVEEIEARMENQWSDEKKRKLASTVIDNLTLTNSKKQVDELHEFLSKGL